jgi:hypothetical protein
MAEGWIGWHFKEKKHEWLMKHKLLLWHIPPYSPELNLIDQLVGEVNKILCQYGNEFKIDYA